MMSTANVLSMPSFVTTMNDVSRMAITGMNIGAMQYTHQNRLPRNSSRAKA